MAGAVRPGPFVVRLERHIAQGRHLLLRDPRWPLAPAILELAHQLLLLRVHRDDWLRALLKAFDRRVDVLELSIPIRMVRSFFRLAFALQAVAGRVEQSPYRSRA